MGLSLHKCAIIKVKCAVIKYKLCSNKSSSFIIEMKRNLTIYVAMHACPYLYESGLYA